MIRTSGTLILMYMFIHRKLLIPVRYTAYTAPGMTVMFLHWDIKVTARNGNNGLQKPYRMRNMTVILPPTGKEKVFTLSTCVGDGSSPYRLVIHAVTVAQKEVANAEKKRLKAKVRARICMILACLLLCGTGVSLWNGKRAEKSVSNIDTGQKKQQNGVKH